MRGLSAAVIAALLSLLAAAQWAPDARALSCVARTAEEHVERADVVLVGAIQSVHVDRGATVEVAVERYLKGSGPAGLSFRADSQAPTGGMLERDIGQRWLLFLDHGDGRYVDPLCSASRPLDLEWPTPSLEEVEAVTGPGVEPAPEASEGASWYARLVHGDERSEPLLGWAAAAAAGAMIALAGLGAVYIRRRQGRAVPPGSHRG